MSRQLQLLSSEQIPPVLFNAEAEAVLLGYLLFDNAWIDPVAEKIAVDDFYDPLHQRIYHTILAEAAQGNAATPPVLWKHFQHEEDRKAGVAGYIAELTGASIVIHQIWSIVDQVADLAKRRRLRAAMQLLQQDLLEETLEPVEKLVDTIDMALADAVQRREHTRSMSIATAFDRTLQGIEDEAAGLTPQGIRIAQLDDFNSLTGDLRRGELIYLGGRPSMGKTALAIRIALGSAENGHGTLLISIEMRLPEIVTRAMSDLVFDFGNCPKFEDVRRGKFSGFDRDRLKRAREQINEWPLIITDPSTLHIGRLAMMIRRYQRQMAARGQRLDLVIVDYLGLIKGNDKVKRYEEVGEISRILKQVAKQCDVAMVVLAQLNRECEKREDKRPQLSDLRDAGDIEQDADIVMFVYREEYYLDRSEPDAGDKKYDQWVLAKNAARDRLELITAKVRNGRIGKRVVYFFGDHQAVRGARYFQDRDL